MERKGEIWWGEDGTEATKNVFKDVHADREKKRQRGERDRAYQEVHQNLIILNVRSKTFHFKAPNSSVILPCIFKNP